MTGALVSSKPLENLRNDFIMYVVNKIRAINIKKCLFIKKGRPYWCQNFSRGGAFLIIRNLEIGRRPENLSILSRKIKGKRVLEHLGRRRHLKFSPAALKTF